MVLPEWPVTDSLILEDSSLNRPGTNSNLPQEPLSHSLQFPHENVSVLSMNQPHSPRSGPPADPASLVQDLFGVHFAPGGPLNDPNDLEGLDFGLIDASKSTTSQPSQGAEIVSSAGEQAETSGHTFESGDGNEGNDFLSGLASSTERDANTAAERVSSRSSSDSDAELKPDTHRTSDNRSELSAKDSRRPVPRLLVPRDDDDDGFGSGLLDAFDDDDSDEEFEPTVSRRLSEMTIPDDDDDDFTQSHSSHQPSTAAESSEESTTEGASRGTSSKTVGSRDKDDFWDALEGWDWETSNEEGSHRSGSDSEEISSRPEKSRVEKPSRAEKPSQSSRSDRSRGGRSRSDSEEHRDDRPRRGESKTASGTVRTGDKASDRSSDDDAPPRNKRTRSESGRSESGRAESGRAESGRDSRSSQSSSSSRPGARDHTGDSSSPSASLLGEGKGGFADDLFQRLESDSSVQKKSSRHQRDQNDDLPRSKQGKKAFYSDDPDEAADSPRGSHRQRGRSGDHDDRSQMSETTSSERRPQRDSDIDFEARGGKGEDDGFGSGHSHSSRTDKERESGRGKASSRERTGKTTDINRHDQDRPRSTRRHDESDRHDDPSQRRNSTVRERERDEDQDRQRRTAGSEPSTRSESTRSKKGNRDLDARSDDRIDAKRRSEHQGRRQQEDDAPAERQSRARRNDRDTEYDRDTELNDHRSKRSTDRSDEKKASRRSRDESVRHGESERRDDERQAPAGQTRSERRRSKGDDSSEGDSQSGSGRAKIQAIEVPTWEHAISLLFSRHPRQERGDRPGGGPERGGGRGRGRRDTGDR